MDTEGFVLRAEVHSDKVTDRDGIEMLLRPLLRQADTPYARLEHLWVGAGYEEKMGARLDWAEKELGWSVELV